VGGEFVGALGIVLGWEGGGEGEGEGEAGQAEGVHGAIVFLLLGIVNLLACGEGAMTETL
jgi:hypothetical protein